MNKISQEAFNGLSEDLKPGLECALVLVPARQEKTASGLVLVTPESSPVTRAHVLRASNRLDGKPFTFGDDGACAGSVMFHWAHSTLLAVCDDGRELRHVPLKSVLAWELS